jgi:exonuclease III
MRCILCNAQSLGQKSDDKKRRDLHELLYSGTVDCFLVCESWLTSATLNTDLDPKKEYDIIRRDRKNVQGGGVCAFVRKSFKSREVIIELPETDPQVEMICFEFDTAAGSEACGESKYRVFLVYRTPSPEKAVELIKRIVECLSKNVKKDSPTFIVGDFNFPDADWEPGQDRIFTRRKDFHRFVLENGFKQLVKDPTRKDSFLDLVFTNRPELVSPVAVEGPFSSSDHKRVKFELKLQRGEVLAT